MKYIALLAVLLICFTSTCLSTPLDDYVNKPDSHYSWVDTGVIMNSDDGTWTGYVVNMTSQQWLTPQIVSRSIWWHLMVIVIPTEVDYTEQCVVYITGGANDGSFPDPNSEDMKVVAFMAVHSKTVSMVLFQIPNERITFYQDPTLKDRTEDSIIAYTWMHFIHHTNEPEWILELPMTKAAVRSLDTVTAFMKKFNGVDINTFHVAGASKRGWTTWLVAAVDKRVVSFAPIVLDELNFVTNIHHHYKAYGGWSFALQDYYAENYTAYIDDPGNQVLMDIIDPIVYVDRYNGKPKLICDAGMDEFFLPDDQRYWWTDMTEPRRMLMVPNAEHSMISGIGELLPAITTFFMEIIQGNSDQIPTYDWSIDNSTGEITMTLSEIPEKAHLWTAHTCNSKRRDFRAANLDNPCECGYLSGDYCLNIKSLWSSSKLSPTSDNPLIYKALVDVPTDGRWVAFFIDVQYKSGVKQAIDISSNSNNKDHNRGWPIDLPGTLEFTSGVSILPDTFPYDDCHGAGCYGVLL